MTKRVVREKLATTIVRDEFLPAIIALVANDLLWTGTRIYHHRFGIHTNEWRVLSALGNYPGANAKEICTVLGLDKSVVSRSAALLRKLDLVVMEKEGTVQRLYLTEAGAALHDEILPIAVGLHQQLLAGFTESEEKQLQNYLLRLLANAEKVHQYEAEHTGGDVR